MKELKDKDRTVDQLMDKYPTLGKLPHTPNTWLSHHRKILPCENIITGDVFNLNAWDEIILPTFFRAGR